MRLSSTFRFKEQVKNRLRLAQALAQSCKGKITNFVVTAVLCIAMLIGLPNVALAAETMPMISEGADIAAEKIDQFAQAYLQVLQLLSDREPELPAAESSAEALEIQQSIESEAVSLIQNTGLTLPEYMQILDLASQDETFQDKVLGRIDDSVEEP
ncbi:MAG: DUF4168 domain-containing protein [Cyanobacteria bacterium J06649_4]